MKFTDLPALGAPLEGGTFCGIVTAPDGTHHAVVLLDDKSEKRMTWEAATAWAESVGGQLPTMPVASMLFANSRSQFEAVWYWTCETYLDDAYYARACYFSNGNSFNFRKSFVGLARAVRLISVEQSND